MTLEFLNSKAIFEFLLRSRPNGLWVIYQNGKLYVLIKNLMYTGPIKILISFLS